MAVVAALLCASVGGGYWCWERRSDVAIARRQSLARAIIVAAIMIFGAGLIGFGSALGAYALNDWMK